MIDILFYLLLAGVVFHIHKEAKSFNNRAQEAHSKLDKLERLL